MCQTQIQIKWLRPIWTPTNLALSFSGKNSKLLLVVCLKRPFPTAKQLPVGLRELHRIVWSYGDAQHSTWKRKIPRTITAASLPLLSRSEKVVTVCHLEGYHRTPDLDNQRMDKHHYDITYSWQATNKGPMGSWWEVIIFWGWCMCHGAMNLHRDGSLATLNLPGFFKLFKRQGAPSGLALPRSGFSLPKQYLLYPSVKQMT